jgi:hypothetical protein
MKVFIMTKHLFPGIQPSNQDYLNKDCFTAYAL